MCGIIGRTGRHTAAVHAGISLFSYRGPDADGFFESDTVTLGHRRLAIIDLDSHADQPMATADGMFHIVYNGEIYNYRALKDELARIHGVHFRTMSDTEVLLEGYRVWGEALLPKLRGMYAFAIHDNVSGELFLARDHAGIKPLYYAHRGKELYFASEIKGVVSLLRAAGESVTFSGDMVGRYLMLGYVPSPRTLVDEIKKLSRGSWLRFNIKNGESTFGVWSPDTRVVTSSKELQEAVRASVCEHTIADVPVGLFFSGGIDSSVVALALRDVGIDVTTYSVRVLGRDADAPYFRSIANKLGVRAQTHDFGMKEFEGNFEHVFSKMDDPIADPSVLPLAFISRIASRDVKVVLSGEGGDELFLGYPRARVIAAMNRQGEHFDVLHKLYAHTPSFRGKRGLWGHLAWSCKHPVSYYLASAALSIDALPFVMRREVHDALARGESLWLDRDWYLENMLLRKNDMGTMYASIEGRVPLLGAELWNNAPRFSKENLAGGGKGILKDMLRATLPSDLIDRPKSGFGISLNMLRAESVLFQEAIAEAKRELTALFPTYRAAFAVSDYHTPLAYGMVALYRSLKNML